MLKKDNLTRVLEVFFDDPVTNGFQLREIGRIVKLAPKSVKIYLTELQKEGLIVRGEHRLHRFPIYRANRDSEYFKLLKQLNSIRRIHESGLLFHIRDRCMPEAIVLFGSSSRGEDTMESDIDMFIQSKARRLDLREYEKKLRRTINVLFESDIGKISPELRENIMNGHRLYGYLRVEKSG